MYISGRRTDRLTDRQTDRWTYRLTDIQTGRVSVSSQMVVFTKVTNVQNVQILHVIAASNELRPKV